MTSDVKLLPDPKLPTVLERFVLSSLSQFKAEGVRHELRKMLHDYARANMEPLIEQLADTAQALAAQTEQVKHYKAENQRLQGEFEFQAALTKDLLPYQERAVKAEAEIERLAEALRMMVEMVEMDGFGKGAAMDTARAALDQEGRS